MTKNKPDISDIKKTALRLLNRREHSAHELTQKLRQRGFAAEDIIALLTQLQEKDFINNHRFACAYLRTHTPRSGDRFLKFNLQQQHRIDEATIAAAMAEVIGEDEDEYQRAEQLVQSKYRNALHTATADKNKIARFLYSRGFADATIRQLTAAFADRLVDSDNEQ